MKFPRDTTSPTYPATPEKFRLLRIKLDLNTWVSVNDQTTPGLMFSHILHLSVKKFLLPPPPPRGVMNTSIPMIPHRVPVSYLPLVPWPASITDLKPSVLSSEPRHVGKRTKNHRDHTSVLMLVKDNIVLVIFNWLWLKACALCVSSSVSMNDKSRPLWSWDFFFFLIWQNWWINIHTQCISGICLIVFTHTDFFP